MEGRSRVFQVSVLSIILTLSLTAGMIAVPSNVAAYTSHTPVIITGDGAFTPENGVTSGSGTQLDPYVIEGWDFESGYAGIQVVNTSAHFVIRDIYTHNNGVGIVLRNVTNGTVLSSEVYLNWFGWDYWGIVIDDCTMVNIFDNNISIHDRGIYVRSSTLCNISGNNLSMDNYGICLEDSTNCVMSGNTITQSYISAVQLDHCEDNTVHENSITDLDSGQAVVLQNANGVMVSKNYMSHAVSAFSVVGCHDVHILDNVLERSEASGAYVTGSHDVIIQNNTLSEVFSAVEVLASENVSLVDNTMSPVLDVDWSIGLTVTDSISMRMENNTFLTAVGVSLWGSELEHFNSHTIPLGNTLNGSDIVYLKDFVEVTVDGLDASQLIIANCSDVYITSMTDSCLSTELYFVTDAYLLGNEFRNAKVMFSENVSFYLNIVSAPEYRHGIECWYSDNLTITLNLIEASFAAVLAEDCRGVLIEGNFLMGPGDGVSVYRSSDVWITSNTVALCAVGIRVAYSTNAAVEMNAVAFCDYGISIDQSAYVTLWSNDVVENLNGIALWSSDHVLVYSNNICNNSVQALDSSGVNSWDAGYPEGGNYWYDYDGRDEFNGADQDIAGPDGIGDTPYALSGNEDLYPLMNRVGLNAPPAAHAGGAQSVDAGTTVTFDGWLSWDDVAVTNYTWTFTYDGAEIALWGVSPTFVFDIAGEYVVTLTVSDAEGLTATDTVTITVTDDEPPPAENVAPVADAGADQLDVITGDTVVFDGSGSADSDGTIASYAWTFAYDGATQTLTGTAPTFAFQIPGTFIVTLNVTDDDGAWDTDTLVVVVEEAEEEPPPVDDGDDGSFLETYGLPIALTVVVLSIVAIALLLLRRKKGA